ncbi:TRAP transporter small permease [Aureimonas mangrovi]|uniref:TRAP transporter small permease n=1 Tax=Aureimonas mangrovi TaxID=2758041 RepID=UPI00163DCB44|nr:TRAP transporter small permease [Aureimonas mangrovi]
METLRQVRWGFTTFLEIATATIVAALTILIVLAIVFRYTGASLTWYDEVASVGLVWMTYFGSALAAAKGAHIGFPGIVNAMPPRFRVPTVIFSELCVFAFFILLAYAGWEVLVILEGMTMTSLPSISVQITQAIIPLGAAMFIVAEALRLPEILADARSEGFVDHELKEALGDLSNTPLEDGHAPATGEPRNAARETGRGAV